MQYGAKNSFGNLSVKVVSRTRERVQREESRLIKMDPQKGRGGRRTMKFQTTSSSNGNSGRKPFGREDVKEERSGQ